MGPGGKERTSMFSRSTLRYALVATVAAASAMAMLATAAYAHNDGFNDRIAECFDSRDPNSDECLSALEVSPVGADFFAQLATNVANRPAKQSAPTGLTSSAERHSS